MAELPNDIPGLQALVVGLKADKNLAVDLAAAGFESIALATSSKGIATSVMTTQAFKTNMPVGGELSESQKEIVKKVTKLNSRDLATVTREFKQKHRRYDATHRDFDATARKLPKQDPNKALLDSAKKHTLEMPLGVAKRMKTKVKATEQDVYDVGHSRNSNFSRDEARKIIAGNLITAQSHNLKVRKSVYKGTRDQMRHDPL